MNTPEAILIPSFLSPREGHELFQALVSGIQWDERMKARKTACFGQTYDDSGVSYEVVPMHPLLVPLCASVGDALGFQPTNCLLNYYENGRSSMGFHSDATYNLAPGTGVAILSIGAERELTFRSKADPGLLIPYMLPHGSLFHMSAPTQEHWTHAVKKTDTDDARISLTFRHIVAPDEIAP